MIKLTEELAKKAKQEQKAIDTSSALREVKLLMQGDSSEDLRIAMGLGREHSIARIQDKMGDHLQLEKVKGKYLDDVFTLSQIKELALKYNLRFLSTVDFKGTMDVEVLAKIKEFAKKANEKYSEECGSTKTLVSLDNYELQTKFFILAPPQMFKLEKVRVERAYESALKRMAEAMKDDDPVLFYKIDDTHYRLIHKWGNDFSVLRYISGFKYRNFVNNFTFNYLLFMPLVALITFFVTGAGVAVANYVWFSILTLVFNYFFTYLTMINKIRSEGEKATGWFSEQSWNSNKIAC